MKGNERLLVNRMEPNELSLCSLDWNLQVVDLLFLYPSLEVPILGSRGLAYSLSL